MDKTRLFIRLSAGAGTICMSLHLHPQSSDWSGGDVKARARSSPPAGHLTTQEANRRREPSRGSCVGWPAGQGEARALPLLTPPVSPLAPIESSFMSQRETALWLPLALMWVRFEVPVKRLRRGLGARAPPPSPPHHLTSRSVSLRARRDAEDVGTQREAAGWWGGSARALPTVYPHPHTRRLHG